MKNFTFMLWMVLWPLVCNIGSYLIFLEGKVYSKDVTACSTFICLCIWINIAKLLYIKKGD